MSCALMEMDAAPTVTLRATTPTGGVLMTCKGAAKGLGALALFGVWIALLATSDSVTAAAVKVALSGLGVLVIVLLVRAAEKLMSGNLAR